MKGWVGRLIPVGRQGMEDRRFGFTVILFSGVSGCDLAF